MAHPRSLAPGGHLSSRTFKLARGETVYELRLSGPAPDGAIILSGSWKTPGRDESEALPELRARVAAENGELRLTRDAQDGDAGAFPRVERVTVVRQGRGVWVGWAGRSAYLEPAAESRRGKAPARSQDEVRAPMTGLVVEVRVSTGQHVARDQVLAVIEAMKMEYRLTSPRDGEVVEVSVVAGQRVELGAPVARLKTATEAS